MSADRLAAQPWLIAGRLLFAPFAPRDGGPTAGEAEAIQAMVARLRGDRHAGMLPDSVAFWFSPLDGQVTSLTANQAWLRARVMLHVVVDLHLVETMGRVVALTLLTPAEPGYGARAVRRAAPAAIPSRTAASPAPNQNRKRPHDCPVLITSPCVARRRMLRNRDLPAA